MDRLRIRGGVPLRGKVQISGAKNAALPILFASILTEATSRISRVPLLADIDTTLKVLDSLGLKTVYTLTDHQITVDGSKLQSIEAPYDLVRTMRASVLVLGPLLARKGEAKVSLPGGCAIGARPVDFHLSALEQMGATFTIHAGYIHGLAMHGLKGAKIRFPFPSVGATENVLMAATLARGTTVLENAACEPEIVDLAAALRSMGARISGEGTSTITIQGVEKLGGMNHSVVGDRVEAGTYLCAGVITRGEVTVEGVSPEFMKAELDTLRSMGAEIRSTSNSITAMGPKTIKATDITTAPFPGFPTDMQAQLMAVLTQAVGESRVSETIFENRFMHVPELARLGAKISIQGNTATVAGPTPLSGATVMATDLRASASLILAALVANGETLVRRIYHLDRGYEHLEEKLSALGASVVRERE